MISINEFENIELIVGKILEVDDIPTKKPIYKLKVDLGEYGIKNIAAGIKNSYSKEELIHKNIVVVANLNPKKIMDFISEGMLLATENDGNVILITTDRAAKPGSKVG